MWFNDEICIAGQHERVYFIGSGSSGLLVDCGSEATYRGNMESLVADGVDLDAIKCILVTHEHFDHIGAIGRAKAELGCPVISHSLAVEVIETGDPLVTASENRFLGTHVPFLPAHVDASVDEGDVIAVGGSRIEVFHIPGHTRGGAAYLWGEHLLVGDTIFTDGGVGWADVHWGSCLSDHRESIKKIIRISPGYLLPGHGEPGAFDVSIAEAALEKLKYLERAEDATRSTIGAPGIGAREPVTLDVSTLRVGELGEREGRLWGPPNYEFNLGELSGFVRPQGQYHGLVLLGHGMSPVTQPGTCTINLEHYCRKAKCAPFLPRRLPMYHGLEDRKVWIEFPGTSEWPAQSRLCYDLTDGGSIDLEFEFEFGAALEGFEAFIASYFHGGRLPYVCLHDGWSSPEPGEQCQLFIPRDEAGASLPGDGRWDWLEERGIRVAIHPDKYRLAVLVDWDRKTGWALVQMIDPDACPSISINSFCHAQDISLLGQDVERGEKVRVRGRIAYICIEDLEEIEHVYRAFLAEVR